MKKICYVTTVPGTLRAFVSDSARYLYDTGEYDISFIADGNGSAVETFPDFVHFYPVQMGRGINFDGVAAIKRMTKIFKEQQFDLVQYSTPNASLYASIAAKRAKIPVRLYCQWGMAYVGFDGLKRKVFKAIEKTVCKNSTWIEPDSFGNLLFSHAEGLYPESKGSVVWNGSASGVDLNRFDISRKAEYKQMVRRRYEISTDSFVFGFMGRLSKDKGVNELLEAFRRIADNNASAKLLIAGNPENTRSLQSDLFEWAVASEQVLFIGYTKTPEQFFSALDCYVLPSYREGFGMTVVEAESMDVPVIITNIPGPTDGIVEGVTGLVVEKKNATSLYDAMKRILEDSSLREYLSQNGRSHIAEKFEQKILFQKIYEDRNSLLKI